MSVGQVHIYVRDRDFHSLGRGSYALKAVLERLSWFGDDHGYSAFPKVQTLADALGVSPRAIQRGLRKLEEEKLIEMVEEANHHRPRIYRIDIDRILSYPLTETGRNRLEREQEASNGHKSPGVTSTTNPQKPRGDKLADQGRQVGRPGVTSTSSHIDEESLQESEEESMAHAAEDQADAGGDDSEGPPPTPACAIWQDNMTALAGLKSWPLLRRCIPDDDDGETLTLAIETPLVGFGVLTWAAPELGAILSRRVVCVVRRWVQLALVKNGVMRVGTAMAAQHRRNGEIVTLEDAAWRLWCTKADEIEALTEAPIWVNCLPDDLDQNGLHLAIGSVTARNAINGLPGEGLAELLGTPILPQTYHCLDQVLAIRLGINGGVAESPEQAKARAIDEADDLAWLTAHMKTVERAQSWLVYWKEKVGSAETHRRLRLIINQGPTGAGLNDRMASAPL